MSNLKHSVTGRGRQYLSPDYDVFNSKEELVAHLKELDYSQEDIEAFLEKVRSFFSENKKVKKSGGEKVLGSTQSVKRDDQQSKAARDKSEELPANWRFATEEDETVIYNEEGVRFSSRREAAEWMIKNSFPPQVIYSLWSTLDREGWELDNKSIPPGWRQKYHPLIHDYKYVTRELKLLNSSEEALKFIKDDTELSKNFLSGFQSWVEEVRKKSPKIIWKTDPSLPEGWLLSCGLNKLTKQEILKHISGGRFETKQAAINFMIKERHSSQDIFKIWTTLHTEGWVSDESYLPRGWKRKYISNKKTHFYLSPMMEVVKSSAKLLDIVSSSSDYDIKDVEKIEKWRKKGNY